MAEKPSRRNLKRPFVEDDNESKRARFSKGKKLKQGDVVKDSPVGGGALPSWKDARSAASIRALHRMRIPPEIIDEETLGFLPDVRQAEARNNDNEEAGVAMEPFNLDKEREEGYFEENGNYVEYEMDKSGIKDAWVDSVDDCEAGTSKSPMSIDEKPQDLAEMKRRIADVLEPGETVLQGLRRLKGSDKKQKMCAENKRLFEQLTEDAMNLMESGDYNVYDEKQESFEIAGARKHGESDDMFGDDAENPSSVCESEYVFDESCGYYYCSSLGYYYDPASGEWYSYNQESGTFAEVQQATTTDGAEIVDLSYGTGFV